VEHTQPIQAVLEEASRFHHIVRTLGLLQPIFSLKLKNRSEISDDSRRHARLPPKSQSFLPASQSHVSRGTLNGFILNVFGPHRFCNDWRLGDLASFFILFAFGQFAEKKLGLAAAAAIETGAEHGDDPNHVPRQLFLEARRLALVDDDDLDVLNLTDREDQFLAATVPCVSAPSAACAYAGSIQGGG
jgi:hypothetical protein